MKKVGIGIIVCMFIFTAVIGLGLNKSDAKAERPYFRPATTYMSAGETKADIANYKIQVQEKLNKIQTEEKNLEEDIFVTITLNKPLDVEQITELVQTHDLKVKQLLARAIEKDGLRATMGMAPVKGKLFDEEILEHMLSSNRADFKGFIEIVAEVNLENIDNLCEDKNVFLVDPSADDHLVKNPNKNTMPGIFWNLEDCGLANY